MNKLIPQIYNITIRDTAFIAVFCFICFTFFSELPVTANFAPRLFLTMSIVNYGEFNLNHYGTELQDDYSLYKGSYFSDKPVGASLLMIPQYIILGKPFEWLLLKYTALSKHNIYRFVGYVVRLSSAAIYSACSIALFFHILVCLKVSKPLLLSMLVCFGTLIGVYSTTGTGEAFATLWILLGYYFVGFKRNAYSIFLAGVFLSIASLITNGASLH